jgi:hypothetical protein
MSRTIEILVTVDYIANATIEVEVDDNFDENDTDALIALASKNVGPQDFDEPEFNDVLFAEYNGE